MKEKEKRSFRKKENPELEAKWNNRSLQPQLNNNRHIHQNKRERGKPGRELNVTIKTAKLNLQLKAYKIKAKKEMLNNNTIFTK